MWEVLDSSFSAGLSEIMKYILLVFASLSTSLWNVFRLLVTLKLKVNVYHSFPVDFYIKFFYLPLQSLRILDTVFPFSVSSSWGDRWNSFPWHKLFLLLPLKKSNRISSSSCGSSALSDNWFWIWVLAIRTALVWRDKYDRYNAKKCTVQHSIVGHVHEL